MGRSLWSCILDEEKVPKGSSKHKENSTHGLRGHETPPKGTPVGSKAQTKFPSKTTGRPLPNSNDNCAEVKIDNTDMELDFDEDNDEDGPEGNENTSCAQDERVLSQNESHRRQGVRSNNVPDENSSANETPTSW
uniref:Uncharacterized protein n=1 Tax=Brassica oleracea TaxID=3712 RepID=A0A3P6EQ83_BRAOL|nr:unnamed protein product [Brassica oleracea]